MYPNLKLQLWRTGVRQNRLAQMVGVDEATMSRVINGFRKPNRDLQDRVAAALACDAAWLFEQMEHPAPAPVRGHLAGEHCE